MTVGCSAQVLLAVQDWFAVGWASSVLEGALRQAGSGNSWLNDLLGGLGRSILLAKTGCSLGSCNPGLVARCSLPRRSRGHPLRLVLPTLVTRKTVVSRVVAGSCSWLPGPSF